MKQMLSLALAVLLVFSAGCSQKSTAGFTADDLQLSVADTAYHCGTKMETVLGQLGDDYVYAEGKSCVKTVHCRRSRWTSYRLSSGWRATARPIRAKIKGDDR